MSHLPPAGWGRATPRWSVVTGWPARSVHDPVSTAGLLTSRAWVGVGPPLFWSGPSFGSVFVRSPVAWKPQVSAPSRLLPAEVNVPPPAQLPSLLPARIEALKVYLSASLKIAPPGWLIVLPAIVEALIVPGA